MQARPSPTPSAPPMQEPDQPLEPAAVLPPADFAARAQVTDPDIYAQAEADVPAWWAEQALLRLDWDTPFEAVLDDSNPPFYTWFADGTLNASYNCLDRHVQAGHAGREAEPECPAEPMEAEHPLFLLCSSGSTAKPKGIVHTTGGYLTGVATTAAMVFDLDAGRDVFWCTADVGWITGHSYVVYGPMANGVTSVMYEGAPDYPDKDAWWQVVEQYRVSIFYTAPTAIRACMKWGEEYPGKHDLSSLRLLGTVGEPINPRAWLWYFSVIGGERCPVVDTWWQTETGAIMIAPLPGLTPAKPGSATRPLPGVTAGLVGDDGREVTEGDGLLVLTRPWPSMLRTLYRDPDRYVQTYFSRFGPRSYFAGDGARRDEDGYFWITGRIDDVINTSGHRLSTAEIESALVGHAGVAEAAVIAVTDDMTGQAVVAYVTVAGGVDPGPDLAGELREHVAAQIGKFARPQRVIWAADLPKTLSGKIMRRLLRDIADGRELGDVSTLADPSVVTALQQAAEGSKR